MIHRYKIEFNIEQNHIENDPYKFYGFLQEVFASFAKLELIRTGSDKKDSNEFIPVLVTSKFVANTPKKSKSIEQQMANLTKGK